MRPFYINNRQVTKDEWSDTYKRFPEAPAILKIEKLPDVFHRNEVYNVISPERAKEIRKKSKYAPEARA